MKIDYATIKRWAAEARKRLSPEARKRGEKVTIENYLAMSDGRDPFYVGRPATVRDAEWFAQHVELTGLNALPKFHLRKMHYKLANSGVEYYWPNGRVYGNTPGDWKNLQDASAFARHLRLVDPAQIADHRNPKPQLLRLYKPATPPYIETYSPDFFDNLDIPSIADIILAQFERTFPEPLVYGYDYDAHAHQPYVVEVWCEKSTMDELLLPICERYHVNYVPGEGYQSITAARTLIERAKTYAKPVRVIYISDLDAGGLGMPLAVSRQVEYELAQIDDNGTDIALHHAVLTYDQAVQYDLPRIPNPKGDKRVPRYAEILEEGRVELDALDAKHPGTLESIVEDAIKSFVDDSLEDDIEDVNGSEQQRIDHAWDSHIRGERAEYDRICTTLKTALTGHPALTQLLDDVVTPAVQEFENLRHDVTLCSAEFVRTYNADLPEPPQSTCEGDSDDWLYDSSRDYFEQLKFYHRHKPPKT